MKIKRLNGISMTFSHGDHKFVIDFGKEEVSLNEVLDIVCSELEWAQDNISLGGVERSLLERAIVNWLNTGGMILNYDEGN